MSCHKPLLAVPTNDVAGNGKRKYVPIGAFEKFKNFDLRISFPGSIKIPCGQCLGCRMDNCRSWADRMMIELDHSKKAVFLTLTYRDEDLPMRYDMSTGEVVNTLQKRDLTNFFKRLRKRFAGKELRYYACGEYGSRTHRPRCCISI